MKPKILILLCIVMLSFGKTQAALSRDTIPVNNQLSLSSYNELMKKSHRQFTAGGIIFCGGAVVTFIGTYMILQDFSSLFTYHAKDNGHTEDALIYTGLSLMLLAIPFNIAGLSNKRKAKLFLKKESLGMSMGPKVNQSMTSFGIKINF